MDNDAELIRQQMTQTRTALTEKLETLEHQVVDTVQEATAAVNETVVTVKDAVEETVDCLKVSVHETIENVKETLSVQRQVRKRPWGMFAGAVVAGYVGGRLLSSSGRPSRSKSANGRGNHVQRTRPFALAAPPRAEVEFTAPSEPKENWLTRLGDQFAPEIDKIKGLAIGTTMALLRDIIVPEMPPAVSPRVREVFDSITTKLGGEAIHEPIIEAPEDLSPAGSR
jgi:hypothetical protein